MPKMKTKRAAAKRFKVTASGKIKHKKAMKSHLLINKNPRMKKQARNTGYVSDTHKEAILRCLPYAF